MKHLKYTCCTLLFLACLAAALDNTGSALLRCAPLLFALVGVAIGLLVRPRKGLTFERLRWLAVYVTAFAPMPWGAELTLRMIQASSESETTGDATATVAGAGLSGHFAAYALLLAAAIVAYVISRSLGQPSEFDFSMLATGALQLNSASMGYLAAVVVGQPWGSPVHNVAIGCCVFLTAAFLWSEIPQAIGRRIRDFIGVGVLCAGTLALADFVWVAPPLGSDLSIVAIILAFGPSMTAVIWGHVLQAKAKHETDGSGEAGNG